MTIEMDRSEEPVDRLVSGEAVELDVRVAGVGSRVLARILDALAQGVLYLLLLVVAVLVVEPLVPGADAASTQALTVVVAVVVLVGYPVTMETLAGGRTIGKLALGLRVVGDDGGPIRFRHALTRCLVAVAVEWPGLVLPFLAPMIALATMLAHPRGKRIGDLAAGTIVIHERAPAAWGWVPAMPPHLASWASLLDLTRLDDELALALRHYLARNRQIHEPARSRIGYALAVEVSARVTPPPPPGVPGWAYLAAVLAERHRRATGRLAANRAATASVWPDAPPAWPGTT
ncbi:transporter [Planosporangium mesophilum]|uniref:Transporter n=2 Tax=Planosporangium mesophilum TaxID=689768 RepID=A0A8J3TLJ8_9ACTN|nr:transporter [Planosporangium mesophilum]